MRRIALLMIVGLVGCGEAYDGDVEEANEPLQSITSLQRGADGAVTSKVQWVKRSVIQQMVRERQDLAARPPLDKSLRGTLSVVQDTGCSVWAVWLFDAANGTGNMLCFDNVGAAPQAGGSAWLPTYGWGNRVRSYWPGDDGGGFYDSATFMFGDWFSAGGPLTNAGTIAAAAESVGLNGY